MASKLTNQSRNLFSEKFMVDKEEALGNINQFSLMTIISFILVVSVAIYSEGIKFIPSYLSVIILAGFCFHSYQQVLSPVTHSVGNCLKRVVVIISSVIFFRTPVSLLNSLVTALALVGVFLYSSAKRMKPKSKSS